MVGETADSKPIFFTIVSIVTDGLYTLSVLYTTRSCKMMFPVNYLVYYLVFIVITMMTNQTGKYNT